MRVKLITPEEVEIGKDFMAKIVEVSEAIKILVQAHNEPEVFLKKNGEKCWFQNPPTAAHYAGSDWSSKITKMSLDELNEKYPTGDTLNILGEPKKARDIYYPDPEKPYPFKRLRGLLTLNPKPTRRQIIDLGFNTMMPYAGSVDWDGNYISITTDRPGRVIIRHTGDERDCRSDKNGNPTIEEELALLQKMQKETPAIPIGFNLNCVIGCNVKGGYNTITEFRTGWLSIINEADCVLLNCYPYRSREGWEDPIAVMERFWNEWSKVITIPIVPVIQAHWGYSDTIQPDPVQQVKFWFGKGLTGYVAYCWRDSYHGVRDMQDEWKEANNWARKECE